MAASSDGAIEDGDASLVDTMPDMSPPVFCPSDPHLRLCLSFDQSPLPAMVPNEGAVAIDATLTNVSPLATNGGGAVQMDTTSMIFLPESAEMTGIVTIELWVRYDTEPENEGRMGLVDSNTSPNISLFFYRVDPVHQLRCGIGGQTTVWDATLAPSQWMHLVCTCDGGSQKMYVDGVKVGDTPGACTGGGAFVADGFTIGANNNGGNVAVSDPLLGAIDGVRLWDVTITPN